MTPVDWTRQRSVEDVAVGDELDAVAFPLPVYRLVMAAAGSRDFNSIHHNSEFAKATGAPEMYANNTFLQSMWERAVREYIGLAGTIQAIRGFRMRTFSIVASTVTVRGEVTRVHPDGRVELKIWSETEHGTVVGPGTVEVTLPERG